MNDHDQAARDPFRFVLNRRSLLRMAPLLGVCGVSSTTLAHRASAHGSLETADSSDAAHNEGTPVVCASPGVLGRDQASPEPAHTITMTDQLRFDPDVLRIEVGETIEWVNASSIPHTATDDPARNPVAKSHPEYAILPEGAQPWSSELLQPGERYRHTFDTAGDYRYFCIPHVLSGMRGSITVTC